MTDDRYRGQIAPGKMGFLGMPGQFLPSTRFPFGDYPSNYEPDDEPISVEPEPKKKHCTLGCTGPWHDQFCDLRGTVRYTK